VYQPGQPCLPTFYLYAELEGQCSTAGSAGSEWASSKVPRAELEHVQQLVARYEAEEGAAVGDGSAGGASSSRARGAAAAMCGPAVEGGGESWSGEAYEADAVLAPPGGKRGVVGAAYLKFAKQLARCPDQCARYW
jgi:hypothetical protein